MQATVVITTKNRRDELRRALQSCFAQVPRVHVLVIDDGSSDGTEAMVRNEFPEAAVVRSEVSRGLVVQRKRAAELAADEILVSLDDDAVFSTPNVVRDTLADFCHPRVGAVAIPWINVRNGVAAAERQRAPSPVGVHVCRSYTGMAHAVRRELFLRLGGYHPFLIHGGEEADFCARLPDAGYVVRLGNAAPVLHYESGVRNLHRQKFFVARAGLLWGWYHAPASRLLLNQAGTAYNMLAYGVRHGYLAGTIRGLLAGTWGCLHEWRERQPMSVRAYCLWRELGRTSALPLSEIAARMAWGGDGQDRAAAGESTDGRCGGQP
jgi:GT2 family glycosyltransferase